MRSPPAPCAPSPLCLSTADLRPRRRYLWAGDAFRALGRPRLTRAALPIVRAVCRHLIEHFAPDAELLAFRAARPAEMRRSRLFDTWRYRHLVLLVRSAGRRTELLFSTSLRDPATIECLYLDAAHSVFLRFFGRLVALLRRKHRLPYAFELVCRDAVLPLTCADATDGFPRRFSDLAAGLPLVP